MNKKNFSIKEEHLKYWLKRPASYPQIKDLLPQFQFLFKKSRLTFSDKQNKSHKCELINKVLIN